MLCRYASDRNVGARYEAFAAFDYENDHLLGFDTRFNFYTRRSILMTLVVNILPSWNAETPCFILEKNMHVTAALNRIK
jgi:hypothetical protein